MKPSREELELLAFAKIWIPYGGGSDEEILVNFGLRRDQYLRRLRSILDSFSLDIDPKEAASLRGLIQQHAESVSRSNSFSNNIIRHRFGSTPDRRRDS